MWVASKPGKKRLMDTIAFSNRERILIANNDSEYMSILAKKLPKADYAVAKSSSPKSSERKAATPTKTVENNSSNQSLGSLTRI